VNEYVPKETPQPVATPSADNFTPPPEPEDYLDDLPF